MPVFGSIGASGSFGGRIEPKNASQSRPRARRRTEARVEPKTGIWPQSVFFASGFQRRRPTPRPHAAAGPLSAQAMLFKYSGGPVPRRAIYKAPKRHIDLMAVKPLGKMIIFVLVFGCFGSAFGQRLRQDFFKRVRLDKWCRTHSKFGPETISRAVSSRVLWLFSKS